MDGTITPQPADQQAPFKLGHRPCLDGVRGVAVLAVLAFHVHPSQLSGGFLGVDVFFCLSGLLITSLLLQEWDASGTISFRAFYLRRALRLLPALVTVLTLALDRLQLGLSIGVAAASFYGIERHFLRLKHELKVATAPTRATQEQPSMATLDRAA